MYTIVKHLSCMFDQRRHGSNASTRASHWLSRKSFDWCLQLALAASPNRTSPSAYNNTFFRPLDSRGVALVEQARSGLTWHDMHYGPTVCRRRILRALFVPFHLRSRRQPAFCFDSAISQVQLPSRARDARITLQCSNLAGADVEKIGGKMINKSGNILRDRQ